MERWAFIESWYQPSKGEALLGLTNRKHPLPHYSGLTRKA